MHADDDALQADENDIVGVVDDLKPRDVAFAAVVPDSQAAAVLGSVIPHVRAPPLAFFRNGEHRCALAYNTHAHNAVALFQADGADACGRAAQRTGIVLTDADGHAVPRRNDQLVFAAGDTSPRKGVSLVQVDGDKSVFADVAVICQSRALDDARFCDHRQIAFGVVAAGHAQHACHLFAVLQRQQVHNVHAAAGTAGILSAGTRGPYPLQTGYSHA